MSVETLKSFFDGGTVVLLFLTFAFGFGAWKYGNIVNDRQAEQLRQFKKDLKDKDLQIAQLEAIASPRDLTESKSDELIAACKPFSGRTVHVRSQVMDLEGWRFAQQVIAVLRRSGLNVQDFTLNLFPGFGTVIVGVRVSGPPSQEELSSAIRAALGEKIAKPTRDFNRVPEDQGFVTVFVGVKPIPGTPW